MFCINNSKYGDQATFASLDEAEESLGARCSAPVYFRLVNGAIVDQDGATVGYEMGLFANERVVDGRRIWQGS